MLTVAVNAAEIDEACMYYKTDVCTVFTIYWNAYLGLVHSCDGFHVSLQILFAPPNGACVDFSACPRLHGQIFPMGPRRRNCHPVEFPVVQLMIQRPARPHWPRCFRRLCSPSASPPASSGTSVMLSLSPPASWHRCSRSPGHLNRPRWSSLLPQAADHRRLQLQLQLQQAPAAVQ
jgi:hypothetical protein